MRTIINAIGITHTAARAIFQLKKNNPMTISVVEINAPISSGIQCELAVSIRAQSDIIAFVRSDKSFLLKNESGSRLNFSASALRLTPLST